MILFIKTLNKGQKPKIADWALTIGMFLTSLVFVFLGIQNLSTDIFYSIVLFSFSTIGLYCCGVDLYNYIKKPANKFYWLFIHIFRMSHGFIAALTAFLVNNSKLFPFLPQVLLLIIPIAIGQPIISFTIWSYNRKMNKMKILGDRVILDETFAA
jgi:amino acid transporter